jgi:hypothetical protein
MKLFEVLGLDHDESKPFVDKICKLLFKHEGGTVYDRKHGDTAFYGVQHEESTLTDENGNKLWLTFDNSTSSKEFGLNSLTPLHIKRGSDIDLAIHKLYNMHKLKSKHKVKYIIRGKDAVVREVHLGKDLNEKAVQFISDLRSLIMAPR